MTGKWNRGLTIFSTHSPDIDTESMRMVQFDYFKDGINFFQHSQQCESWIKRNGHRADTFYLIPTIKQCEFNTKY